MLDNAGDAMLTSSNARAGGTHGAACNAACVLGGVISLFHPTQYASLIQFLEVNMEAEIIMPSCYPSGMVEQHSSVRVAQHQRHVSAMLCSPQS